MAVVKDSPSWHKQLQLNISADSRIANVTVYPDRAEVTRAFHLQLKAGKTAVTLTGGFPYMKTQPVFSRLEKEGDVTLFDVEITEATPSSKPGNPPPQTPKPVTHALEEQKELLQESLSRCELAPVLLGNYVKQLDLQHTSIKMLDDVLEAYDQQGYKWGKKIQTLKNQIHDIENEIEEAQNPAANTALVQAEGPLFSNHRMQLALEANSAVGVELRLVYYVMEASWVAEYDITVTSTCSEDEEMKVDLTYKAIISNDTVETWENVDLVVESKQFAKQNQSLSPWILAFDNSGDADAFPRTIPSFTHNFTDKVSISKGSKKTVGIAQIQPQVLFERSCTPSVNPKVRVKGHITNNTEYPFNSGNANIYLEGNYHDRIHLRAIAAGEAWSIPLGLDDKVRVIYPPYTKVTDGLDGSKSGIKHVCRRQITISNTRKVTIASLLIVDNFSRGGPGIFSWLRVPALKKRERFGGRNETSVVITDGIPRGSYVSARWDRAYHEEEPEELDLVKWECKVGPSQEIHLEIVWEVSTTKFESIRGFQ